MENLTHQQIEAVTHWMETWEQLKDTAIPIRFKEDFTKQLQQADVSGSAVWDDDKVIDFVNWYLELHKLDFRYTLENRMIIESFKNGNDASKWHCH